MPTLTDLANRLEALTAKIEKAGSEVAVEVAKAILTDLEEVTPVDTTKALSNWQVSIGSPATTELDAHVPGHFGWTATQSGRIMLANAEKVLQNKKPGASIFLSNLAPYIVDLNEGSSRQAPAGFVERAELKGRLVAAKIKLKL